MWCVSDVDDEYVRRMEDLLDLYEKEHDPLEPVICLDEKSIQLTADVRPVLPMKPGKPLRPDYEYERKGTANAFYMVQPKVGKHIVKVTETRSAPEFAEMMRGIGNAYPRANKIHVVLDNLNTHCEKSLLEQLGPKRGANLWNRFDVHYTPVHGSWLNQAEIGISLYARECLGGSKGRIPTIEALSDRSYAWQMAATNACRTINWKFTKEKAREKFGYSPLNFTRPRT